MRGQAGKAAGQGRAARPLYCHSIAAGADVPGVAKLAEWMLFSKRVLQQKYQGSLRQEKV